MTTPPRLIEGKDGLERDLLRSAYDDRPHPRAMNRMLSSLGVNLDRLAIPVAQSSSASAVGGSIGNALVVKWLVGGMAVGVTTVFGAQLASTALERPSVSVPAVHGPASSGVVRATVPSRPPAPSPSGSTAEPARAAPAVVADSRVPRVASKVSAPTLLLPEHGTSAEAAASDSPVLPRLPEQAPTLSEELRLLDMARGALSSGQASAALSSLAKYDRSFPNGALQPEAAVLKVRALLAAGDRTAAETLARGITERAPRSEHADAVRAALGVRTNP